MKGKVVICGLLLTACGCDSMNHTEKGMLGGGLVGTGVGAAVGRACGNTGLGAVVGGLFGTVAGAAVGNSEDRREYHEKARAMENARVIAANQQPSLSVQDVISMTHQHIPPDVIMRQIEHTNSYYNLSVPDITAMTQNGVNSQVIGFMQGRQRPANVTLVQPAPTHVYIHEPPPPPVVGVGFGYTYGPRYRHW